MRAKAYTRRLPMLPALFVVNADSKSTPSYSIASDGSLTLPETTPVTAPTALPADARLAPDGSTLWVVDSGGNTVRGFAVDSRTVTELPDSPTPGPAGAQPIGIVVTEPPLGATPTN